MKKAGKYLLIAIALGLAGMTSRVFFTRFPAIEPWRDEVAIKIPVNFDNYVQNFSGGLQFQTFANGDDFTPFAGFREYLKQSYPVVFANMEYRLISGQSMLLKWKGKNPGLEPILVSANYDVIPADQEDFSGMVKDGNIFGRGTLDNKNNVFAIMSALQTLIEQGWSPQRDMYFAFPHDEETGDNGAIAIAKYLKGISFDAIFDEGTPIKIMDIKGVHYGYALISVAEKGYITVRLKVSGEAGHSSMPSNSGAIENANEIIMRLRKDQMPARLTPQSDSIMMNIGSKRGFLEKFAAVNGDIFFMKPIIKWQMSKDPETNAMIRTTTAFTGISTNSPADNALPDVAEITINLRLQPGDKIEDVISHIKKQTKSFQTEMEIEESWEASSVSPIDTRGYEKIKESVKAIYPLAFTMPIVMPGSTDSYNYQLLGKNIYRFSPVAMTSEQLGLMHAKGEYISVQGFANMISFYVNLFQNYDSK
jgi:carboxypeptidase PM20D1